MKNRQDTMPLFEALKNHIAASIIPLHVPGHKGGAGLPILRDYLGNAVFRMDLNAMNGLDDLHRPVGAIRESQRLMAELFGAREAFFLINGTTSGIHAMMLSSLSPGEKILVPRSSHRSVFSGLILSGAVPVYIPPDMERDFGLLRNIHAETVRQVVDMHPDAKKIIITNPNYYGFSPKWNEILPVLRLNRIMILADEAHGCLSYFHPDLPDGAIHAGAEMSAVSIHKTGGSFTQSSILLGMGNAVPFERIRETLGNIQTTSASYLLMASLDVARCQLAHDGYSLARKAVDLVRYASEKINETDRLFTVERVLQSRGADEPLRKSAGYDRSKLVIHVGQTGYTGFTVERILREQYQIQIEMSDMLFIVPLIGFGDSPESVDRLVEALSQIARRSPGKRQRSDIDLPEIPKLSVLPREAFYADKKSIRWNQAKNEICGEMISSYPPGIPLICPGEIITDDIIRYIGFLKNEHCILHGSSDPSFETVRVLRRSLRNIDKRYQ